MAWFAPPVTHTRPLSEIADAFALMTKVNEWLAR